MVTPGIGACVVSLTTPEIPLFCAQAFKPVNVQAMRTMIPCIGTLWFCTVSFETPCSCSEHQRSWNRSRGVTNPHS